MTDDEHPLEELLTNADEELELEDVTIDTEQFHADLVKVAQAAESIETLATDLRALRRSGLTDEDVVALLYGRNASLNKSTIETALETIDETIADFESGKRKPKRDLLVRLVYDLSGLGKQETETVVDELEALVERYGYDDLQEGDDV
ncbi:hypothetical protein [Natronosalvus halobius]|uniref:hypothetical protein n=1 Tax=Natronosalvus halobius TaxID=2953746 RepID=UPI00209CE5F5|nr:hypothetical protein [Natronosalvus halobius]USZ73744.1 hypothetical protein NGM15_18580 [Natronosalvus halobius]